MSDPKFIPIEEATKTRFASSTSNELAHYVEVLGLEPVVNEPQDKARARVLAALGLTDISGADRRRGGVQSHIKPKGEPIRPPYNLSPNGLWGGRRRRIKLPRPEGAKLGQAEAISWNGKATYWLPYDRLEAIPYPIYMILVDRRRRIVGQEKVVNGDGGTELRTKWDFAEMPIIDMGDDPLTADRAVSMSEWYRSQGVAFYKRRNTRELQAICNLLEIPLTKGDPGTQKTSKTDEDMLADIFTFLYGYPDVSDDESAEEAEAEA